MNQDNGDQPSDTGTSAASIKVSSLWKVFGKRPERALDPEYAEYDRTGILKDLGCVVALRDVSFDVAPGETFVVMGLSGSGKSTLVRCLIRLIEPTAGAIAIADQDILQFDDQMVAELRRNRVSMVFQHYGLLPHRNVLDNTAFGLEVRGVDQTERQERAAYMLEKVGLKGWEYAATSELSGGMQQRVGLARALTGDPEVLLMDEPFSGLDPLIRAQMREELAALQEELKKTIVFITHDLDEAITVGDRIAIMRDGRIIQLGTPEDIVANPIDGFVAEFTRGISKTRVLPVDRIMQPPCFVVSQQDACREVISVMETSKHPYAFIVDDNQECVGIATKEQIESGTAPSNPGEEPSLQEIDSHQPQTVATGTVIEDALPLILGHDFPIPVAGDNGELLGMVCQPDILEVVARSVQDSQTPVSGGSPTDAERA